MCADPSAPAAAAAGLVIARDDPRAGDVVALLQRHLAFAHEHSPPEDVHALDRQPLPGLTPAAPAPPMPPPRHARPWTTFFPDPESEDRRPPAWI